MYFKHAGDRGMKIENSNIVMDSSRSYLSYIQVKMKTIQAHSSENLQGVILTLSENSGEHNISVCGESANGGWKNHRLWRKCFYV